MSSEPTFYDLIKGFNVDDMAVFITQLCRERDEYCLEALHTAGIDASLVSIAFEIQVEDNKRWLLTKLSEIS